MSIDSPWSRSFVVQCSCKCAMHSHQPFNRFLFSVKGRGRSKSISFCLRLLSLVFAVAKVIRDLFALLIYRPALPSLFLMCGCCLSWWQISSQMWCMALDRIAWYFQPSLGMVMIKWARIWKSCSIYPVLVHWLCYGLNISAHLTSNICLREQCALRACMTCFSYVNLFTSPTPHFPSCPSVGGGGGRCPQMRKWLCANFLIYIVLCAYSCVWSWNLFVLLE